MWSIALKVVIIGGLIILVLGILVFFLTNLYVLMKSMRENKKKVGDSKIGWEEAVIYISLLFMVVGILAIMLSVLGLILLATFHFF